MSGLNVFTFSGRLGDAPKFFDEGKSAVWKARVACDYGFGDNKGTNWITVTVFGKRAESLDALDLLKGSAVGVTGELRTREYDKKDGSIGFEVEVVANDVALLGPRPDGDSRKESNDRGRDAPRGREPERSRGREPERGRSNDRDTRGGRGRDDDGGRRTGREPERSSRNDDPFPDDDITF